MPKRKKLSGDEGSDGRSDCSDSIDSKKCIPTKTSERIRAKRLHPSGHKWSAISAAFRYETDNDMDVSQSANASSYGDETNDDVTTFSDPEDADSNPQWQLFEAIRSRTNSHGTALSDPFMRLPSRRFYPDYYEEIKSPMSLAKIRAKIKTGAYDNVTNLVEDLSLTFENAMKYNRPDSKIFKDALKLKKVLQLKAQELFDIQLKESDESESDDDSKSSLNLKTRPKQRTSNALTHELKKARRSQLDVDSLLKKRMRALYKALVEYTDETGRQLIVLFMEKPSKKFYPDYYEIIASPIDMKTIESNIKWERYPNEESLIADFRLMFSNCKQYNEDNSQIYKDAVTLENVLIEKLKELGPFQAIKPRKSKGRASNVMLHKMRTLYNTVKDYTDPKGRQLSLIFMKLPSKTELPEYYDVIKKPVGLEKIGVRLKNGVYETLEDLLSDMILMLDNACKYNEPDSQIYKDALTLQQIALQTKIDLMDDSGSGGVPDVKAITQELLTNLFISVYNHQDEEGRCFSDSIIELSEIDSKTVDQSPETKPLNLDIIKRNLDKGKYRRLDRFQKDMFEVFERARRVSRTDSQAFEDSVELQTYFIYLRNELCRHTLKSTALQYTEEVLNADIEALKRDKIPKEQSLEELLKPEEKETEGNVITTQPSENVDGEESFKDLDYSVGDFVYIEPREKTVEPHIIHIEKLSRDQSGEVWLYGCWFFRPGETFHIASKKFLEQEVFKSDSYNSTPLSQVVGKCYVMFVKDYFRSKPRDFDDKDVYVCESRYFTRAKTFKKIKVWPFVQNIPLTPRENPLPMIRVPSVFKDQTERIKVEPEDEDDESQPKFLDIDRTNVECDPPEGVVPEEGVVFYEQYSIPSGSYKLGDCCYVRTDQGRNLICRIDRMWVDKEGNCFFHGPWFVQQPELPPLGFKSFYPQEVFLSSIEDTNPLLSICSRCAVIEFKDYITQRPTEIPEKDVYVCESRYLEHEKKFQKLIKGLPRFAFTSKLVTEDEIYYFRKPLVPQKIETGVPTAAVARKGQNNSEMLLMSTIERVSADTENEESNDNPVVPTVEPPTPTPVAFVKKRIPKRLVTGYIVFASEVRKSVVQANPECSFGDVSRIIGTEWKNLPPTQKSEYEQKAQRQNELTAQEAAAQESMPHSPASANGNVIENAVYECHWESKCDFQFEEPSDLLDHLISEPNGHVWQTFGENKDKEGTEFQCLFQGCGRVKKGAAPFPTFQRLIRHCKEVHVSKQTPKSISPENRNKNFIVSRKRTASPASSGLTTTTSISQQTAPQLLISHNSVRSHSSPSPALSIPENSSTVSMSSLHPTLSQAIGANPQSSHMPILSPFWTSGTGVQVKPIEPLFVGSPPRSNRLVHTHTYMKYIEKLRPESRNVSNWETQLTATQDNTPPQDLNRLPTHWLANGAGNHGTVVNALWALRNFMMRDALNLSFVNN